MTPQTHRADYSRYFAPNQKAYLIDASKDRDQEQYDSLSGVVVECRGDTLVVQVPFTIDQESQDTAARQLSYKITTESRGDGLQVMANLVNVTNGTIFNLKLFGAPEIYQRRTAPRIDTTLMLHHVRQDFPLALYRKEFKRINEYMKTQGTPPNLRLQTTPVNLGMGGIRIELGMAELPPQISLLFLGLADGNPPVCAVAEMVWNRLHDGARQCGFRFVLIRKSDQERINRYVQTCQKNQGINAPTPKINWDLIDRMTFEETK